MKNFLFATSALVVASLAIPVHAQTADDGANEEGDVIIVTARKREENLIDVPLPVTVATKAQLDRDQVYGLNDLQRVTPALEISQTSGGETNGGGRLRGVGTGVFNSSVASSVAVIVDQVPIGNLSFPQLFDMAQVEVLRGPQGTLFGQGASAGVLNITTVAPTTDAFKVSGSVDFADKGTAGSEVGELVVNAGVNVPLGAQAALRLSTQYKKETGLQRSVTTGRDNKIEDFGVRLRALLEPTETLTINLTGQYAKNTSDGQNFFAIAIAPNRTTPFGPPGATLGSLSNGAYLNATSCAMTVISARAEEYCEAAPTEVETTVGGLSAVIDLELSDAVSVTSVSGYRERTFDQVSRDFSRITGTFAARQELTRENSRGFSQELRASISSDSLDLVVGTFYSDFQFDRVPIGSGPFAFNNTTSGQRVGFSICNFVTNACIPQAFNPGPLFVNFAKETTENRGLAGFVDATVKLGEQFSLFGGLRYDDYKNTTSIGSNTLTPTRVFVTTDNNLSGRIGASFKPNPDTNIFASYSIGYKPPAVGTNPAGALFQLKPEKSDAVEIGVKTRVGRVQLSANAFYTKLQDFQSQTSIFVGTALISQPLNVPKLTSKGFEVSAFGQVLPGFNVNAGYQFNDFKYPTGYVGDDGGNLGGTQFLNAPRHKFTLSGDYGVPVSDNLEVFLNANLVYKSKVLLAQRSDPRYRYPSHEIINLGFGVRHPDGDWNASVFVRNLTKEREPTAYLASTFAGQADGGIRAWPVAGLTARVVGVRAGFAF
jgi:outer membrane receptor protein involved in Fe transport